MVRTISTCIRQKNMFAWKPWTDIKSPGFTSNIMDLRLKKCVYLWGGGPLCMVLIVNDLSFVLRQVNTNIQQTQKQNNTTHKHKIPQTNHNTQNEQHQKQQTQQTTETQTNITQIKKKQMKISWHIMNT